MGLIALEDNYEIVFRIFKTNCVWNRPWPETKPLPHKAYSHHEVKYANQREYANTFVGRLVGMQCYGYLLCYPDSRFSAFSTLQLVMFFCPPPEALLLVWSTYRTGFSLLLPKKVDVLLLIIRTLRTENAVVWKTWGPRVGWGERPVSSAGNL